jgi:hypothetical protein
MRRNWAGARISLRLVAAPSQLSSRVIYTYDEARHITDVTYAAGPSAGGACGPKVVWDENPEGNDA